MLSIILLLITLTPCCHSIKPESDIELLNKRLESLTLEISRLRAYQDKRAEQLMIPLQSLAKDVFDLQRDVARSNSLLNKHITEAGRAGNEVSKRVEKLEKK